MATTLYNTQLSPYCARVRLALYKKGVEAEILHLHKDFEFEDIEKINFLRKVPTLVHDGRVIGESEVILHYLDDIGAEPKLMPEDIDERIRARKIGRIADLYLSPPIEVLLFQIAPKGRDEHLIDEKILAVGKALSWLSHLVGDGPYAVGNRFSYADCMLLPMLFYVDNLGPFFGRDDPLTPFPKLQAYYKALPLAEESAKKVLAEMQVSLDEEMMGG